MCLLRNRANYLITYTYLDGLESLASALLLLDRIFGEIPNGIVFEIFLLLSHIWDSELGYLGMVV